jgi:hypothetical protein
MKAMKYAALGIAVVALSALVFISCRQKGGKLALLEVTPASAIIATGTSQQFAATAIFSDGTALVWTSAANWTTDNPDVTIGNTFGSYGLTTSSSIMSGTTSTVTIKATDIANNISGEATLYVTVPQTITVSPNPIVPYMTTGTSHQFASTALLSAGTMTTTQDLTSLATWTTITTDPTIAKIGRAHV